MVASHWIRSETIRFRAEPVMRMVCFSGPWGTVRQGRAAIEVDHTTAMASATAPMGRRSGRRAGEGVWFGVFIRSTGYGECWRLLSIKLRFTPEREARRTGSGRVAATVRRAFF